MDRNRIRLATALMLAGTMVLGVGCFERTLRPVNPCTRANVGERIRVQSVDKVDLLFMVDNSNSMTEEQTALGRELPRMVRVLASGDIGEDGTQDFEPVRSMHIGVITSDMGVGGYVVPTCDRGTFGARFGDDGVLITRGRTADARCMATYPQVFDFLSGTTDPDQYAIDVGCVAATGTGGCGFEQQLEAVLKAVSPSTPQDWTIPGYQPPLFFDSTQGHGGPGGANADFLRPDSALAIILVTDEEDCSVVDPELFDMGSATYTGDLNLRCFNYPATQHPIERYVRGTDGRSGLIALRHANPNLLIFAGIVGVPVNAVPMDGSDPDYNAILAHPDMQEMIDPAAPPLMPRLRPSCNTENGIAFPPVRIVRTAQALAAAGASTTIQSICQSSYAAAVNEIIEKIADALGGACLPRPLNPDAQGFVGCQVFEVLPAGHEVACDALPGRRDAGTTTVDEIERPLCEVLQVGPAGMAAGEQGWFYENEALMLPGSDLADACVPGQRQRIRFTFSPTTNADIRLECLQTVAPSGGTSTSIGSFCVPGGLPDENLCGMGTAPDRMTPLACDAADRTCGLPCIETADCTSAGLLGDVCDTRSWAEAVGAEDPDITPEQRDRLLMAIPAGTDPASPHGFCVNPTCI